MRPVGVTEVAPDDETVARLREAMVTERLALYGVARRDAEAPAELIDPATVLATLLLHQADLVVGTGALRRLGEDVEAKRMFVVPGARGRGYGRLLLEELEDRARATGAPRLLLHTGLRQTAAIALYRATGFTEVPVFEPYLSVPESVCFAKDLAEEVES